MGKSSQMGFLAVISALTSQNGLSSFQYPHDLSLAFPNMGMRQEQIYPDSGLKGMV
jgi:hypothetical protein